MPKQITADGDGASGDSSSGSGSRGSGSGGGDSTSGGDYSNGGGRAGSDSAGGDGFGGGDGTGAGTGKRKRGRPRKQPVVELAGEAPNPTLTDDAPKRGRKRGPDLSVLVDTTVVGLFGLVAVATGHEHWLKERQDVVAITGPLNAWIDQLPAKTLKKVEKSLAPALFVVGLAVVVGPDAVLEAKLRARDKDSRRAVSGPPARSQPAYAYPPAGSVSGPANGASEQPRGGADWYGSIPTGAPSGYSPDEG